MAGRESNFRNMVITLFLVTFVAAGALGLVYEFTKEAIAEAKLKAQSEAIEKVLPSFEELGETFKVAAENGEDTIEIFPAYQDDQLVGYAVKTFTNQGYSGYISIMAGIDNSGNFTGYEVLEHDETPGLGSKMNEWFRNEEKPAQSVIGKNPESTEFEVTKDGGDIDGITASTITSRAFLEALKRAYRAYEEQEDLNTGSAGQ
ncbi:MAG TPA: RnfABCDGE type electron transport complex subunit G [Tangfeifania sp.]|nr:RnfABCDGE type electron transport complex subunit G [Tangfeifania sp.]